MGRCRRRLGIIVMEIKARDLVIAPCEVSEVRDFIEAHHYSHNINGVKISYCFKITHNDVLVGGILFGALSTTAWKKFADREDKVIELRRLVLLDEVGKNSETRVIGFCLRWIKKNNKIVESIVSYADPKYGHSGVIYRASNFQYVGLSGKDKGFFDPETGKTYHSRALRTKYKGDYKPFVKKLREKLEAGKLESVELPAKHCYLYKLR
jgi:hypothetical protein